MRSEVGAAWVEEEAGPWDQAIRGSSALRAAIQRAFLDETCRGDKCYARNLWDIQGFYDSLSPVKVMEAALDLGFPPHILVLEMLVH